MNWLGWLHAAQALDAALADGETVQAARPVASSGEVPRQRLQRERAARKHLLDAHMIWNELSGFGSSGRTGAVAHPPYPAIACGAACRG